MCDRKVLKKNNILISIKMNTMKHIIILAAMTLLPVGAMTQEITRKIDTHSDEFSIVRETPDGRWLVYNMTNGLSYFSRVSDTATVAEMLQLGYNVGSNYTIIHDFEIFNDTVYFCGRTGTKDTPKSIWGYFPLAGFPSVNIFVRESDYDNLKKLEVFSVDPIMNEIHVVMLGQIGRQEMLIDEMRTAPNQFDEARSEVFDHAMRFNDIAVTDSHIVVAAEAIASSAMNKTVFIEKPLSTGVPIFFGNIYYRERTNTPPFLLGNELLKSCEGVFCVLACTDTRAGIIVTAYKGKDVYYSVNMPVYYNYIVTLRSMCYGKHWRNLEILTRTASDSRSVIHSLYPALAGYGGTVYQHIYQDENLASLDWLSTDDEHIIASGHDFATSTLQVYRYNYSMWNPCTERETVECLPQSEEEILKGVNPSFEIFDISLEPLESFDIEMLLKTVCK